jgi:hypothetical protein
MDSVAYNVSNCKKAVKQIERNNRERLLLNNWSLTISIHHFTTSSLFRRHTIYDIRNTKKFDQGLVDLMEDLRQVIFARNGGG